MEKRFQTGTIVSGIGHAGLVVWMLVGDWLFGRAEPQEVMPTQVSMISSAEFAELQATTASPSETDTGQEGSPAAVPEEMSAPPSRPEPQPEPQPEPVAEQPAPAPEPAPEPPAAAEPPPPEPQPEPEPTPPEPQEVVALPPVEEPPVPVMSNSPRPKPRPSDRVSPTPNVAPEEAETAPTPEPAVSETPVETPEPPQEAREETVAEDSGDILRTEATEEQEAPGGMQASPRPKPRPNRPTPVETPRETPAETPRDTAADTAAAEAAREAAAAADRAAAAEREAAAAAAAEQAAIDAALAEAAGSASESAGSGGGRNAPVGPPLNAGEIGNISSAIGNKWNLGAVSSEVMQTMVVIRVEFDQSGKPGSITLIESQSPSAAAEKVAFDTARRAVIRAYQDGGIPLPADKYETWKVLEFVFDANGMRMR